jgi:uncharacterized OsmC-like protein
MTDERFTGLTLEQVADYKFRVRFEGTDLRDLATDEPAPLGHGAGPNPSLLLMASVANCLAASLLFALRKFRSAPGRLGARARTRTVRNDKGRWRIAGIEVELQLSDAATALPHLERALAQFEDFCIVTESVRAGIPIAVRVRDAGGSVLHTTLSHGDGGRGAPQSLRS